MGRDGEPEDLVHPGRVWCSVALGAWAGQPGSQRESPTREGAQRSLPASDVPGWGDSAVDLSMRAHRQWERPGQGSQRRRFLAAPSRAVWDGPRRRAENLASCAGGVGCPLTDLCVAEGASEATGQLMEKGLDGTPLGKEGSISIRKAWGEGVQSHKLYPRALRQGSGWGLKLSQVAPSLPQKLPGWNLNSGLTGKGRDARMGVCSCGLHPGFPWQHMETWQYKAPALYISFCMGLRKAP